MKLLSLIALIVVMVLVAGALWRFFSIRNRGTQVVIRVMPSEGVHGWRHGIVIYDRERLRFYKLRSFSFGPDLVLRRSQLDFDATREPTAQERSIMPEAAAVLSLSSASDPQRAFEFGMDRRAAMALISWIESAPDHRQVRTDMNVLQQRAHRSLR